MKEKFNKITGRAKKWNVLGKGERERERERERREREKEKKGARPAKETRKRPFR